MALTRDDFYAAGHNAFHNGKRTSACRLRPGCWQRRYWLRGWADAKRQDREPVGNHTPTLSL